MVDKAEWKYQFQPTDEIESRVDFAAFIVYVDPRRASIRELWVSAGKFDMQ